MPTGASIGRFPEGCHNQPSEFFGELICQIDIQTERADFKRTRPPIAAEATAHDAREPRLALRVGQ